MKLLVTSISIALATSALAAAAPTMAEPTPVQSPESAPAPSPERIALARRFVALSAPTDPMVEAFRAGFWRGALSEIKDETHRAAANERLELMYAKLEPKLRAKLAALTDASVRAYAQEFSDDELRQMIAFAETPAGRHFLSTVSGLEDESVTDAQTELWEELEPLMHEMQKEMCAARTQQRIAAGDTKAKCALSSEPETLQG